MSPTVKKLHKYNKNILTHIKTIKIDLYVKINVFEILDKIKLQKKNLLVQKPIKCHLIFK